MPLFLDKDLDYYDVTSSTTIKPVTGDYSCMLWIYVQDIANGDDFLGDRNLGSFGTQEGWWLGPGGDTSPGHTALGIEASNAEVKYYQYGGITDEDVWICYAFRFDNSADTLELQKNLTLPTPTMTNNDVLTGDDCSNTNDLRINGRPGTTTRTGNIRVGYVTIWQDVVTKNQIDGISNGANPFVVFCQTMKMHLPMWLDAATTHDYTGNGNNGSETGTSSLIPGPNVVLLENYI